MLFALLILCFYSPSKSQSKGYAHYCTTVYKWRSSQTYFHWVAA